MNRFLRLWPSILGLILILSGDLHARDFDQDDLEDVVKKMEKKGKVKFPKPTFTIENGEYDFSIECGILPINPRPIDYPIALQQILLALEKNKDVLKPIEGKHRRRIRGIIEAQLKMIGSFRGPERQLKTNLLLLDSQAIDIMMNAVERYAKDKGLKKKRKAVPCFAPAKHLVIVKRVPKSSQVLYLTGMEFEIEKERSKELERDTLLETSNWNRVDADDNSVRLAGRYIFRLLANGKFSGDLPVIVSRPKTITLQFK